MTNKNIFGLTAKESAEKRRIDRLAMMNKATRSQLIRGIDLLRKINNAAKEAA